MTDSEMVNQRDTTEARRRMSPLRRFYLALAFVLVFIAGFGMGQARTETGDLKFTFLDLGRDRAPKTADWNLLWDTIDKINEKYVDRPTDMVKVLYGAVGGAVAALEDPYSVFLPPQEASDFQEELKGSFEGIGAEIAIKNQRLTVVTPLDGSPAQKAGLRAGDHIIKIGGEESKDFNLQEAVMKIRGKAGTSVILTILRKGEDRTRDITIIRAKIEVKSVEMQVREVEGKKIAVLKMRRFGEDTSGEVSRMISELLVRNVTGLVLDLRNNPGGYLEAAVEVASYWVENGRPVVIQKFGDGSQQEYKAKGQPRLQAVPTVVLMNGGSASASEIVAGALRDYGLAKLLGEKSFGKGSVQELLELRGGAELKLTIAKWLTPNGHDLNKEGLDPDIKVELTDEDFQADRDPQMDRAIELLLQ